MASPQVTRISDHEPVGETPLFADRIGTSLQRSDRQAVRPIVNCGEAISRYTPSPDVDGHSVSDGHVHCRPDERKIAQPLEQAIPRSWHRYAERAGDFGI